MEMKDKILLCIEKQALVQIIIRELPEQLMKRSSYYVSANQCEVCVARGCLVLWNIYCFRLTETGIFAKKFECTSW